MWLMTTREEWQRAVAVRVEEIDSPSVKDAVHDREHHDANLQVWGVMQELDDR